MRTKETFYEGMLVHYTPEHAHGNMNHHSVGKGGVTSINEKYVFVRFESDEHSKASRRELCRDTSTISINYKQPLM